MVWLCVCSKGVSSVVTFDRGTVDHNRYIEEMLPMALKYESQNDWAFQQDGVKPHTHHLIQQWCHDNFPAFIDKDR
jgi:hypothetical protein